MTDYDSSASAPKGKYSIDKDAIKGQLTTFVLTAGATAALGALTHLDLSTVPGWLAGAATYAVTTAIGFFTTYASKK
jgi:hypothetical protein